MTLEKINPESLGAPKGYNNGMLGSSKLRMLFVAGQIGWESHGGPIDESFVEQFRVALKNVIEVVTAAGGATNDIARMVLYVTDKNEYKRQRREIGIRWRELMGNHYPAMVLVEVKSLLEDQAKIEIEATALLPPEY